MLSQTLLQTLVILLITAVDTKRKICKKITLGEGADQYPILATYFKTIGTVSHTKVVTDQGVESLYLATCTGFFVEMKGSVDGYGNANPSKGYFVSAAHCFKDYFDKSSAVVNSPQFPMRLLNKGVDLTISFGNIQLSTPPSTYLTINVTQNPISVPGDNSNSSDCFYTFDIGIVELSQSDTAKVKLNGRFLSFDELSNGNGVSGDNCWVAGFGGHSHDSKLQVANVTFATSDDLCVNRNCISEAQKNWYFCYNRVEKLAVGVANNLTEGGDSGAPVWCLRNGVYKVVGVALSQNFKANASPPGLATVGEKLTGMLIEAYKSG